MWSAVQKSSERQLDLVVLAEGDSMYVTTLSCGSVSLDDRITSSLMNDRNKLEISLLFFFCFFDLYNFLS